MLFQVDETLKEWSVTKQVHQADVQESYTIEEMKMGAKRSSSNRELIDTGTDKRYVRRDDLGQFKESDDVGKSLSQDINRQARTVSKPGQGDRGDQKKK
jgi:hypothetical protein